MKQENEMGIQQTITTLDKKKDNSNMKNQKIAVLKSNASPKVKLAACKKLDNSLADRQKPEKELGDRMTNKGQDVIKKALEVAIAKKADPKVIEILKSKLSNADENNAMDNYSPAEMKKYEKEKAAKQKETEDINKARQKLFDEQSKAESEMKELNKRIKNLINPDEPRKSKDKKDQPEYDKILARRKVLVDIISEKAPEHSNANNNALIKKIVRSNSSDAVKKKAIKKVLSNAVSQRQELEYRKAYLAYKRGYYRSEEDDDAAYDELEKIRMRLGLSKEDAGDIRIEVDGG